MTLFWTAYAIAGYGSFWVALNCTDSLRPAGIIVRAILYLILGPPIIAVVFATALLPRLYTQSRMPPNDRYY